MKILITGADGFIGQNLQLFLQAEEGIIIDTYTLDNTIEELPGKLEKADFIVHLAGVNRPQTPKEFFSGNTDLTKTIVDILNDQHSSTPLIFSSSIQAALDNDYGKSKRLAEDYILDNYEPGIVFRLHNVFGKNCRPNYNSVVATFCHNIANNEPIDITNPSHEIELIYIDDICHTFIQLIKGKTQPTKPYNYVAPIYKLTLSELADKINGFHDNLGSIVVPTTGDDFTKKLFSTYISYNSIEQLIFTPKINSDDRGNFTELIRTLDSGQISVSTAHPGITRGNHYHHTKIEKFIILNGHALVKLRKIGSTEVYERELTGEHTEIFTIPVGYTHSITNIGNDDMILLIWCNELFDNNNPDTYYEEV